MQKMISQELIAAVKGFEGLRLMRYRDMGRTWTIGYGHTANRLPQQITKAEAERLLIEDLEAAERQVQRLRLSLSEGQRNALIDFVFNLGIGRLAGSTLLLEIRLHAPNEKIIKQFRRWVYISGKRSEGLAKRREWEVQQWQRL